MKELTDKEVEKAAKECGFSIIGIKHFEDDTIYYLKDEDKDEKIN